MGRNRRTFRTSISLTPDLKTRMDAVDEDVNWSSVAAVAFEQKLAEIASKKESKSMDDVIQRLRASKIEDEDEDYRAGEAAGRSWAEGDAGVRELRRLSRLREELRHDWDTCFDERCAGAYAVSEFLYFKLYPEHDGDRTQAAEFWEGILGTDERPEPSFVRGFAEGALSLWAEVENKL